MATKVAVGPATGSSVIARGPVNVSGCYDLAAKVAVGPVEVVAGVSVTDATGGPGPAGRAVTELALLGELAGAHPVVEEGTGCQRRLAANVGLSIMFGR
eukprot:14733015-Heterocapsa_arctica.AAC.1